MTFTYELDEIELKGIRHFVRDIEAKGGQTSVNKELTKVIRRFLRSTRQREESTNLKSVKNAYASASDSVKSQVNVLLGVK